MASIGIKTNIPLVTANLLRKYAILRDRELLLRPVANDVIVLMTTRIHERGHDSNDQPIGEYNNSYLRTRQKKYNRTADKKIIVSLTRQLENNWAVIATDKGYGIGFLNVFNVQKARWVEANKNKKIFSLSKSEQEYTINKLQELIKDALNS